MAEYYNVRVWEMRMARGWVSVTVTVKGPNDPENHTPENLAAVGIVVARIGRALDKIQKWAYSNTTFRETTVTTPEAVK